MTAIQHHKLNDFPCFLVGRCFKVQVLHTCRETESRSSGKEQFCNFSFSRHMTEFWTLLVIFMLITHHEQRRPFSSEIFFSKSLSYSHLERASLPRALMFFFSCSNNVFFLMCFIDRIQTPHLEQGDTFLAKFPFKPPNSRGSIRNSGFIFFRTYLFYKKIKVLNFMSLQK